MWLVGTLFSGGLGLIAYLIAWIIVPEPSSTELAPSQSPVPSNHNS
jgi:phage shock protein PspC (stress-responsive transcriptional regulator)